MNRKVGTGRERERGERGGGRVREREREREKERERERDRETEREKEKDGGLVNEEREVVSLGARQTELEKAVIKGNEKDRIKRKHDLD